MLSYTGISEIQRLVIDDLLLWPRRLYEILVPFNFSRHDGDFFFKRPGFRVGSTDDATREVGTTVTTAHECPVLQDPGPLFFRSSRGLG
jgi:hypothetical protein